MSKQCVKPKRKRDEAWFKDKIVLMESLSHYGSDNLVEKEESRNIDRELALEKQAQQFEPKLYDGSVIQKTDAIVIRESEETLMLEDESRSKILQKQKDPMMSEKKVNTKPIDYVALNQLSQDFETRFMPQTEFTTIVEVPKELPKVSMVNSSLKKLKFHLASSDMVVKERTTATAITKGTLQEKVLIITTLKDTLSKLKGKSVFNEAVTVHPIDPELLKIDVAPLAPKLRNNRIAHYDYLKHTQEETTTLREIVKNERLLNTLNTSLDYVLNNNKKIRFTKHIPSSRNTPIKTTSSTNIVSNKLVLSSIGVNLLTSSSGSQPQGNIKKDRIQQTQSRAKKNKLKEHPRNVRPSLHNKKSVVNTKAISSVPNSKLNVNSDPKRATCNGCLFSDNHDSRVLEFINSVNARVKSKSVKKPVNRKFWKPTGKVFMSIGHK
nr:hypothetical protein [Tanacetum cinerariifolium]